MPDYTTVFVVLSRIIECVYFFWSQIQPDNSLNSLTTSTVFLEKKEKLPRDNNNNILKNKLLLLDLDSWADVDMDRLTCTAEFFPV